MMPPDDARDGVARPLDRRKDELPAELAIRVVVLPVQGIRQIDLSIAFGKIPLMKSARGFDLEFDRPHGLQPLPGRFASCLQRFQEINDPVGFDRDPLLLRDVAASRILSDPTWEPSLVRGVQSSLGKKLPESLDTHLSASANPRLSAMALWNIRDYRLSLREC
jgi:hypothetical protein